MSCFIFICQACEELEAIVDAEDEIEKSYDEAAAGNYPMRVAVSSGHSGPVLAAVTFKEQSFVKVFSLCAKKGISVVSFLKIIT